MRRPSPGQTVNAVAQRHGLAAAAIYGRERTPDAVAARTEAVVLLRHAGMSFPQIGAVLDRNHTTVLAAYQRWCDRPHDPQTCLTPDCGRRRFARRLCSACYRRAHRHGTMPPRVRTVHDTSCKVDGCDRKPKGRGYCSGHYQRLLKHGDVRPDVPLGPGPGVVTRTDVVDDARHGTLSGYQAGCGCDRCRDAKQAHTARQRRGETDRRVSTMKARRHVDQLLAQGMTGRQVARLAGVSPPTVDRIKSATRMLATSEAKILAVVKPCEDCDTPAIAGGRWCAIGRCGRQQAAGRWSWSRRAA